MDSLVVEALVVSNGCWVPITTPCNLTAVIMGLQKRDDALEASLLRCIGTGSTPTEITWFAATKTLLITASAPNGQHMVDDLKELFADWPGERTVRIVIHGPLNLTTDEVATFAEVGSTGWIAA